MQVVESNYATRETHIVTADGSLFPVVEHVDWSEDVEREANYGELLVACRKIIDSERELAARIEGTRYDLRMDRLMGLGIGPAFIGFIGGAVLSSEVAPDKRVAAGLAIGAAIGNFVGQVLSRVFRSTERKLTRQETEARQLAGYRLEMSQALDELDAEPQPQ